MMTELGNKIKVLVVEDSAVQRELLTHILESDKSINVVGIAMNGEDAIEILKKIKPHVIVMDLHMPKMNGVDAIRYIMSKNPLPIIAISASDSFDEVINGFHALAAGAVAFAEKPKSTHSIRYPEQCEYLITTVKLMSEVKVVRRWVKKREVFNSVEAKEKNNFENFSNANVKVIAVGVSTGGPLVLQEIIAHLPQNFPPILIVQHIVAGFIDGLVYWLNHMTNRHIQVASDGKLPLPGHIYMAPDHYHMGISMDGCIFLKERNSPHELCPSVNFLFASVREIFQKNAMGILLTGMGNDGVIELKKMKESGAITIAQDKQSALIHGMPGQAISTGATTYVLAPKEIAHAIGYLTKAMGDI